MLSTDLLSMSCSFWFLSQLQMFCPRLAMTNVGRALPNPLITIKWPTDLLTGQDERGNASIEVFISDDCNAMVLNVPSTIARVLVTPNINLFLLLLHSCNFTAFIKLNANISGERNLPEGLWLTC